ncbi:MAG: 4-hydroxy-tetrahydrodipicolinate synthase [Bacteroidaceae bacterium]|nr:4-hydroxy-tetrahydrodipicolinate synthase [Bacteroidaceae bacterium]
MMRKTFRGMGVALVTPFTEEGKVDYATIEKLVQMHLDCGTDFLCVLGTTAETPTLSIDEKREIRKRIIKQVDGRMPIMVGVGGNCTQAVIEELLTEDFTGVDAILSVVPYYSKPTQEGIYQHYRAIASATSLPIFLYNVPGRTGVNMLPETAARIARDCPNVVGYKAASGNIEQIRRLIEIKPAHLDVFSGDDGLTVDVMEAGGLGIISVFGNACPTELKNIVDKMFEGKVDEARKLIEGLSETLRLLFVEGNPCGIKALMTIKGMLDNRLRLPLVPVSDDTYSLLQQEVEKTGI